MDPSATGWDAVGTGHADPAGRVRASAGLSRVGGPALVCGATDGTPGGPGGRLGGHEAHHAPASY